MMMTAAITIEIQVFFVLLSIALPVRLKADATNARDAEVR
jgi:hypothetical protein